MAPRKRPQPHPKKSTTGYQMVGALLALFRVAAGHTQAELAATVIVSESKLASIEQGRRPLTLTLAQELDRVLKTKGALEVAVGHLPDVEVYPSWAAEYLDHERDALVISWYENHVLPGLLQTEGYARALFHSRVPVLHKDEIEEQVAARLKRQSVLHRPVPLCASFVLSEAVLREPLGSDEVWREQLEHLLVCADLPGTTLQVMPQGRRTHAGLAGPFVLFETAQHEHLAYAESQRGSLVIYDPDEVSIITQRYAMLRTQALNPDETRGLLRRLLGEQ